MLVLTTYDTDADIVRAVEAGARGYLLKDAPTGVLADAIRRRPAARRCWPPPVAARLADRHAGRRRGRTSPLRELDVLAPRGPWALERRHRPGLFIGEATVKTHLIRAFAKLGVTTARLR